MVAVYCVVLLACSRWLLRNVPGEHFVGPLEFLYGVAAFFLSLFSSTYLLLGLYRLVLGREEYELYLAYGGEKIRRSGIGVSLHFGKVFKFFFWAFTPPLLLLMAAYIDSYASFTDQQIVVNPFWSLGQTTTRGYQDVQGLYEVQQVHQRDRVVAEPYQVIVFRDGTRWETDHGSLDPKLQMQRDLLAFVAKQSRQPIQVVRFAEDIPAP